MKKISFLYFRTPHRDRFKAALVILGKSQKFHVRNYILKNNPTTT